MGLEHVDAVLDCSRQGGSNLLLLVVIARYSDEHGEWRIDQPTLQRKTRVSRRRVQQILDELVAAGELAVVSHRGRGRLCTYRLQVGGNAKPAAHFSEAPNPKPTEKCEAGCAISADKCEAGCAFPAQKCEADCAFPAPQGPPFPPYPQIPPYPPEDKKETDKESFALAPRPLAGPQSATFRVNLILEEASIPLPSPSQIGLWVRKLGGIEPLLEILRRLIQAGLANKKNPAAYVHRVVMERADRPQPARPHDPPTARVLLRTAGADDARRRRAQEIIDRAQERQGKP